jgi:DNA-binding CsgD family transcriptional regulator
MPIGKAELDLIAAVGMGPFENPPWQSFLELLRRITGAKFAILNFRPPRRPYQDSITVMSGAMQADMDEIVAGFDPPADPPMIETLTEGNLYSLDQLLALDNSREMQIHADRLKAQVAINLRQMRVQEPSGINAWLTVVRGDDSDFDCAAEELLVMISRFLRIALQNYIAIERERYGASLTSQAVRGMFGWIALDPTGLILDHDEQCGRLLANGGFIRRTSSGRLAAIRVPLEREIYAALTRIASDSACRPQAITLNRDPWLDMMIVPARSKSISAKSPPSAIAYVHGDSWGNVDRQEQLAQLFRLSPGEARLALALCRGMTISEAAEEFGLAVGTARNYCKNIFAKTGARGQPDLVRIIMRSVLAIAPDV